jgi:hypothetical protein
MGLGDIFTTATSKINKALVDPKAVEEAQQKARAAEIEQAQKDLADQKAQEEEKAKQEQIEAAKTDTDKAIEDVKFWLPFAFTCLLSLIVGSYAANRAISRSIFVRIVYFLFGTGTGLFIISPFLMPPTVLSVLLFLFLLFVLSFYVVKNRLFTFFGVLPLFTRMPDNVISNIFRTFIGWNPKDDDKNQLYQKMRQDYSDFLENAAK